MNSLLPKCSYSDKPTNRSKICFKISLLGEGEVGKTSIARRFAEDTFEKGYVPTIGVDYQTKKISIGDNTVQVSNYSRLRILG
jgi:GTPase SAR1 family protein